MVVDDSNVIRRRIERAQDLPWVEFVGAARNGREALELHEKLKPTLVTMDLTMPEMDGGECVAHLVKRDPSIKILVISAGTSDIPVAAEAVVTARMMGNEVEHLYDVGVAGIHRLLARKELLFAASVIIVVAGMEGALPSVVAGMVAKPVIGVPTSIGYGASFGGIAALLGMLNSCAAGVTVVNIDNGFGAAYAASLMNR